MLTAIVRTGRFLAAHPLTRDRKLRAFIRFARWQIVSRLHAESVVPWIEGTRLAVRRGMTGATGNIYAGLHEFADMAFVLHFLRPGDLFADIGANVGSYTVLASGVRGARTAAFEPDPEAAAALRRNVALNHLEGLVAVREMALGAAPGEARLTVGLDTTNRIVAAGAGPARTVRMDTLDRALDGQAPILAKLDVEGYESEVLRGAAVTLASPKLKAVLTEDRSAPVVEVLRGAGFELHGYDAFTRRLAPSDSRRSANLLFIRDEAFVRSRLVEAPAIRVLGVRL
jgi:FkbM family methyltransferase